MDSNVSNQPRGVEIEQATDASHRQILEQLDSVKQAATALAAAIVVDPAAAEKDAAKQEKLQVRGAVIE